MNKSKELPKQLMKVLEIRTLAATPTEAQIEKIKPYLLREFSADDLYIRQMHLANDQHDRSHERFDMGYLRRFMDTIVGKSVLTGHDYGSVPVGRFFDATVLQDDQGWNWVAPWFYMPKSSGNQLERDNIDSGVWCYVSIGANIDYAGLVCDLCGGHYYPGFAKDSEPICPHYAGDIYEGKVCTLTWDSTRSDMSKVEAVEGSIVYLGCQYDAAVAKSVESQNEMTQRKKEIIDLAANTPPNERQKQEGNDVDFTTMLSKLSVDSAEKVIELVDSLKGQVGELTAKAEVGDTLKARLVENIKRLAACLKDEITPTVVDQISDVEKLIEIETKLDKAWSEKRGVQPQAEPASGEGDDPAAQTTATTRTAERAFSVI